MLVWNEIGLFLIILFLANIVALVIIYVIFERKIRKYINDPDVLTAHKELVQKFEDRGLTELAEKIEWPSGRFLENRRFDIQKPFYISLGVLGYLFLFVFIADGSLVAAIIYLVVLPLAFFIFMLIQHTVAYYKKDKLYQYTGTIHSIISLSLPGEKITLADGSKWDVSPIGREGSLSWELGTDVYVTKSDSSDYSYHLVNASDGEVVEAKLIHLPFWK